jgi:hypothetical protein
MTYFYINDEARILKATWKEGFYKGFVRKFCVNNYYKTKKEAETALEVKKFINKIIKEVNAKTTTKRHSNKSAVRR